MLQYEVQWNYEPNRTEMIGVINVSKAALMTHAGLMKIHEEAARKTVTCECGRNVLLAQSVDCPRCGKKHSFDELQP